MFENYQQNNMKKINLFISVSSQKNLIQKEFGKYHSHLPKGKEFIGELMEED